VTTQTVDSAGTERLGEELAATLEPGDVVLLLGDLGAGKTTLVRGAARGLGVRTPVTSPTFAIGHRYAIEGGRGQPDVAAVSHLDLYRLGDLGAEDPDLLADYIGTDTISFVEWPGGAEGAIGELARVRYRIHLEHAGGDRRRIEVIAG
jgi:tRNA threonylcarbamoyladenosine biosynthesis protein TsaE